MSSLQNGKKGHDNLKRYIAIDIGGTCIKSAIVTEYGEICKSSKVETPTSADAKEFTDYLLDIVDKLYTEDICGIGISSLGAVDSDKGIVAGACGNLPNIKNIKIKELLYKRYEKPVSVINDVNAAALGEAHWGSGKGLRQFYCITYGTGIGGAFYYNGNVVIGHNLMAGEIGYMRYGNGLSYEESASVKAFYGKCIEENYPKENLDSLLESALNGSGDIKSELDSWIAAIADGIKNIIYILDPGTIIIGGGISAYKNKLTDRIQAAVDKVLGADFRNKTRILPAKAGNSANMLGAVSYLIENS